MAKEPHRFGRTAEDLIASLRKIPSENPSRARIRPTSDLIELIDDIRKKHGIGIPTAEQEIRDHWPEIVGTANASYSHAVRVDERNRLVVHVSHSVVRNELFMNRSEILDRLRKLPGCASIKLLHLTQG
jgi:hypothetical protein